MSYEIQNFIAFSITCISFLSFNAFCSNKMSKEERKSSFATWFLCCVYMCVNYIYLIFQCLVYLGYHIYLNFYAPGYVPQFIIHNVYLYNCNINIKTLILIYTLYSILCTFVLLISVVWQNKTTKLIQEEKKNIKKNTLIEMFMIVLFSTFVVFCVKLYIEHSTSLQLFEPGFPLDFEIIQRCLIIGSCAILLYIKSFYKITRSILVMSTDKDNEAMVIYSLASISLLCSVLQIS